MDLTYKNKEGISLNDIVTTLNSKKLSKKEIITSVSAKKSIDTLLKKLLENNIITKEQSGRSVFYKLNKSEINHKTDRLNEMKSVVSKDNQITKIIEVEPIKEDKKISDEVDEENLNYLKKEMESKLGKEVTAILHHRNEPREKAEISNPKKIYDDLEEEILKENPYRFVLNFFNTTLNNEKATGYFRRRDSYVVKSIYNKFKTKADKINEYDVEQQHQPFYRAFTIINGVVKIYHIDMNRMIRASYEIFKIKDEDMKFFKDESDEN